MNKKLSVALTAAALLAVTALSACAGNGGNAGNNGGTNNGNAGNQPAGETKEITISASNFEFDPPDIQLNTGDTVKITLKNDVGNHGIEIPDLNVNLKNGESATVTLDKAGTYDFHCSIQCGSGHMDMVGKLTVS